MSLVILSQSEVRQLLPMQACIEQLAQAFVTLAQGQAVNPLRHIVRIPEQANVLGTMPAYLTTPRALGVKIVTVFPGNHGGPLDSHQGVVMLFDTDSGATQAIMDASEITAIRTAAASAVATQALARQNATKLAIIGSGVQARTHLEAMQLVRPIQNVRVFSRDRANREQFAQDAGSRYSLDIQAVDSAEAAVRDADVICTVSAAKQPILNVNWLAPGAHINAVGSSTPHAREIDTATVAKARVFVDRMESALNEAGDLLYPLKEGAIDNCHILAELGDVLLDRHPGRGSDREITLFKSLGLAIEDVVAAQYVYQQALQHKIGLRVQLGGLRDVAMSHNTMSSR